MNLTDAWGSTVRISAMRWNPAWLNVRSAGPDRQFDTADDLIDISTGAPSARQSG